MLWCIPMPQSVSDHFYINAATVFMAVCLAFYISLKNAKVIIVAFFTLIPIFISLIFLDKTPGLFYVALGIFILAWIGQFIGHKIEGKRPSFFKDIQFLLIGPLWVFLGK